MGFRLLQTRASLAASIQYTVHQGRIQHLMVDVKLGGSRDDHTEFLSYFQDCIKLVFEKIGPNREAEKDVKGSPL